VHGLFAAAVLGSAAVALAGAWQWHSALRVNRDVAAAALAQPAPAVAGEALLARAVALAAPADGAHYQQALAAYQGVVNGPRDDLARAARYNLGNLYLREALKEGAAQPSRSVPLLELAKQSYRAALRADPGDWDSRHNLQQALQLSPEIEQGPLIDNPPPTPRERTTSTLPGTQAELP
jgi:mxaK protein